MNQALALEEQKMRFSATYDKRRFATIDQIRTTEILPDGSMLERPTGTVIDALRLDDSRIAAFHTPESGTLWDALAKKLDDDFSGRKVIAIRSIEASLDGIVTESSYDTHDIRDILRVGDIKMRRGLNLAGFKPGDQPDENDRIHYRVLQFASQTDFYRKFTMGSTEGSDRIFPVLLVYNTDLLGGRIADYAHRLPDDPAVRAKLIEKAYILDAKVGT
ncbi:MAG: hypothetical protein WAS36_02005 [Candidatus Saccharimonadales bacterium]